MRWMYENKVRERYSHQSCNAGNPENTCFIPRWLLIKSKILWEGLKIPWRCCLERWKLRIFNVRRISECCGKYAWGEGSDIRVQSTSWVLPVSCEATREDTCGSHGEPRTRAHTQEARVYPLPLSARIKDWERTTSGWRQRHSGTEGGAAACDERGEGGGSLSIPSYSSPNGTAVWDTKKRHGS